MGEWTHSDPYEQIKFAEDPPAEPPAALGIFAGLPRIELTADEQIRIAALHALTVFAAGASMTPERAADQTGKFEQYIRTGEWTE